MIDLRRPNRYCFQSPLNQIALQCTRLFLPFVFVFLDKEDTPVERFTLAAIAFGTTKVLDPDLANNEPGWDEGDGPQAKVECRGADALERFERVQAVRDGLCLRKKERKKKQRAK